MEETVQTCKYTPFLKILMPCQQDSEYIRNITTYITPSFQRLFQEIQYYTSILVINSTLAEPNMQ